jgi:hypothetical protein
MLQRERRAGIETRSFYSGFQSIAVRVRNDFVRFLLDASEGGRVVAAYGAAAKGNTLMNFAGVRPDLVAFVADANPAKQGRYTPGTHVPIVPESHLHDARPDFVVILPWNLRAEIAEQLGYVADWGGRFVTAVPRLETQP